MAVVSLGLDRFNGIVSSLGHRAGDEVIKLAAAALRSRLGESEVLGHLSGHEFVIGLPGRDAREAVEWIEVQADALRAGVRVSSANISLQVTGGVACYPEHSQDAAELCRRASSARSEALTRHETASVYRLGQDDRSLQQIRIVGDFPRALRDNELRLYFQPKLDLLDRRDLRCGGPRPLAAPGARALASRLVHTGRRASRQHRASNALGIARSRRTLRGVAQPGRQPERGGQHVGR